MGNSQRKKPEIPPLRTHEKRAGRSALILGATGATGKFILSYLIRSDDWSKVTIIHRREVDLSLISTKSNIKWTKQQQSKVTQHIVDMNKLLDPQNIDKNVELFNGHDIVFSAIGTQGIKNYREIDYGIPNAAAAVAVKAGIKSWSLISSQYANANVWANDWKVSFPFLVLKTKGELEQSIIGYKFERVSIFRPAGLARDGNAGRFTLDVKDLASVIVYDAESDDIKGDENAVFYEPKDINNVMDVAKDNFFSVCGVVEKSESKEDVKEVNEVKEEQIEEKVVDEANDVMEDDTKEKDDKKADDAKDETKEQKPE